MRCIPLRANSDFVSPTDSGEAYGRCSGYRSIGVSDPFAGGGHPFRRGRPGGGRTDLLARDRQLFSPGGDPAAQEALFFIFHLLGAWHEKSAYRPLARLLRCPADDLDVILGDFSVETGPRVMAAVFDGDPRPLYDMIHDQNVDQFIRGAMCETVAIVTLQGNLPREEAAGFLRACYSELGPQGECWVWHGWQAAIAVLGLVELEPLVEEAFARRIHQ